MTIRTLYSIGDQVVINNDTYTIVSMHIYVSENKLTQRLYLGNHFWFTLSSDLHDFRFLAT